MPECAVAEWKETPIVRQSGPTTCLLWHPWFKINNASSDEKATSALLSGPTLEFWGAAGRGGLRCLGSVCRVEGSSLQPERRKSWHERGGPANMPGRLHNDGKV